MDAWARSDRQAEVESWLEVKRVDRPWELANSLVDIDWDVEKLQQVSDFYSTGHVEPLFEAVAAEFTIASIVEELTQAARQIYEIVKALKNYVYLDQGPIQPIDIHESLNNTLVILRNKLMKKITSERSYDPELPRVFAYGSELSQVWQIFIRTYLQDNWAVVEIEDN